jgi:mono/diheme cytochrome c family protein
MRRALPGMRRLLRVQSGREVSASWWQVAWLALLPAGAWGATPDVHGAIERYCADCHNTTDWAGGLDLTILDPEHVGDDAEAWEKVVRKLRAGMMPPPGKDRPSRAQAVAIASALEARLDAHAAAGSGEGAPAPVLHRLNRTEYANAVRDLFGMPANVSGMLPPDDASEGFDNVASGLGISPALIQGYTSAAMKLSRAAVGDMTTTETTAIYQAPEKLAQDTHREGLPLGSRGGMRIEHDFPLDAEYHFSVRGNFGLARNPDIQVDVALDGERMQVPNLRDFRWRVPAGRHVLTAALFELKRPTGVNDIYSVYRADGGIERVEITGPFNATGVGQTESRKRIFTCVPRSEEEERPCARRILVDIASRAFRAPQRLDELADVLRFYDRGREEGGFEAGIQQALSRILIDPRFLFRFEAEPADAVPGKPYPVSDLELASRLSFFLWSSIPDAQLIELAVRRQLHRPEVLAAQVRRMLADRRAYALVENFAGQWLHLRELATVTPEVEGFDENLREAFIEETRALVDWVRTQDRPVTELLTADYSFLNERLAKHYGIGGVKGSHLRKVKLPPASHRRGLLGHGSILTVTSTASRTSPVIRGSWILENLLSAPVPAPPPGVETNLDGDGTQVITTSVRERLELHRQDPNCASCHNVIDPVGFALENFNAIGAWRERDGDSVVDASGVLADGTKVVGPEDLTEALVAHPELFVSNVVGKLMTYALGRAVESHDMPAVRAIVRQAEREELRFSSLVLGVVQSVPFRHRIKAPQGAGAGLTARE